MVRELCATIPPTSQGRHNVGHHETCSATHDSNSPDILSQDPDVDDGYTDRQRHGLRRLPRGSAVRTARRSRSHPRASESGESARRRSDRDLRSAHDDGGCHPQSGESSRRPAFATSIPGRSEGQPSSVRLSRTRCPAKAGHDTGDRTSQRADAPCSSRSQFTSTCRTGPDAGGGWIMMNRPSAVTS